MISPLLIISVIVLPIVLGQQPDPRCPLDNDVPVHLPHEYDCTKFYKCNWGFPVLFDCFPEGTHWSVALDRCEFPDRANCTLSGSSTAPATTISSTVGPSVSPTTTEATTTAATGDPRCPIDDDPINNPVYLPHETDCSLFYLCYFGELILYQCSSPPFLYWSVRFNRCETRQVADCQLEVTTTSSTEATTDEVSSTIVLTTTVIPTTTPPEPSPSTTSYSSTTYRPWDPRCPLVEDPLNPVHLPHETDCGLFWRCDNGRILLERCPAGTHWSVQFDRCEWPEIAQCDANTSIDDRCPLDDELAFLPHEYDCTKFYVCTFGVITLYSCETGLFWNSRLNQCYHNDSQCQLPTETTTTPDTTTFTETQTQEITIPETTERQTPPTAPTAQTSSTTLGYI